MDNKCLTQELHGVISLDLVNFDLFELRKVNIDSQEVHPENGHAHSAKRFFSDATGSQLLFERKLLKMTNRFV